MNDCCSVRAIQVFQIYHREALRVKDLGLMWGFTGRKDVSVLHLKVICSIWYELVNNTTKLLGMLIHCRRHVAPICVIWIIIWGIGQCINCRPVWGLSFTKSRWFMRLVSHQKIWSGVLTLEWLPMEFCPNPQVAYGILIKYYDMGFW